MAQNRQDMGSGPVKPLLLQLMIPAVVAQVVNLLYNIVDRIYIGHIEGIGAAALTGVGLFAPILMLLNAFAMLIGAGGAPRTAIALGQDNKDEAEKIIGNSFTMLLFFAVVLTRASCPVRRLLRLFGASDASSPLCGGLWPHLHPRLGVRAAGHGHEPLHHDPGLCEDQYAHDGHRRSHQHHPRPHPDFGLGWGVRVRQWRRCSVRPWVPAGY